MASKQQSKSNLDPAAKLELTWLPYVTPFAIFMLLTEISSLFPDFAAELYITKTIVVGFFLWYWRKNFRVDFSQQLLLRDTMIAVFCGVVVVLIWVLPENYLYQLEKGSLFNPYDLTQSYISAILLIVVRIFGAAIVVPIMEELFWRSFLMRYLITSPFTSIAVGKFSWFSFLSVAVLFGLAHHRFIVGIIAGIIYGLLLIYQKNLKGVIIAHGTTNLLLGMYTVLTENWQFW